MSVKRVSPDEAQRMMQDDGYVYLDVRSVDEFQQGHPDGAYNIPLMHLTPGGMQPNETFLEAVSAAFEKDQKILVGCRSGGRSLRAAELLIDAGFTTVVDQRAGFEGQKDPLGRLVEKGWNPAGLPTSKKAASGHSYADLEAKRGS